MISRQPSSGFPAFCQISKRPGLKWGTGSLKGEKGAKLRSMSLFAHLEDKNPAPLGVAAVSGQVEKVLAGAFPGVIQVRGEISNLSGRGPQAHLFYKLKDADAELGCVTWGSQRGGLGLVPKDGMEVVATGRINWWKKGGQLRLQVLRMEAVGEGRFEQLLRQRLAALKEAGLVDRVRRALPPVPRRVAVVTSCKAAALRDVQETVRQRFPGVQLLLCDVRVQGEAAAPEITAMLDALSKQGAQLGVDAVILTRGGGSIEDLWAFNEMAVAHAVARCPLPVVAAIGHETDTTLAEVVADFRASTPTQAAMWVVPAREELQAQVGHAGGRLRLLTARRVELARQKLVALGRHPVLRGPGGALMPARARLAGLSRRLQRQWPDVAAQRAEASAQMQRLGRLMVAQHARQSERLAQLSARLHAASPDQVLARGFSYTTLADGSVLTGPGQVKPGDMLLTRVKGGTVRSTASQ